LAILREKGIFISVLTTIAVHVHIILKEIAKNLAELFPGLRVYTITNIGAIYGAGDQTGFFQLFQVLGSGGLRQAQLLYYVPAYAAVHFYQVLENGNTCGVGQRFCHQGYFILLFRE